MTNISLQIILVLTFLSLAWLIRFFYLANTKPSEEEQFYNPPSILEANAKTKCNVDTIFETCIVAPNCQWKKGGIIKDGVGVDGCINCPKRSCENE